MRIPSTRTLKRALYMIGLAAVVGPVLLDRPLYGQSQPPATAPADLATPRWPDGRVNLGSTPDKKGYWEIRPGLGGVPRAADIPFQPWARALYDYRNGRTDLYPPLVRCKPAGGPGFFNAPGFEIVDVPEQQRVFILNIAGPHSWRVIYTDGRPHINQAIRQYLGDSRAHWEGDELVVETTNLTDQTAIGLNGNGNKHSTQMKLTERFKRVADDVLQYQITVDDPVTYVRPFTLSLPLTPLDGGKLLPYDCHEGNYALLQSLGGERAEDRALEEDRQRGVIRERRPVQGGLGVGGQPIAEGAGIPRR